ncbi:MAG: hypothetical protein KF732_09650 [Flavobacteriales bacterium]|nr:hypothetical protein [Flavobacteriales bacterium]
MGVTVGLAIVVLLMLVVGVHENVEPNGPVGEPPICTEFPKQIIVSLPAFEVGEAKIVTLVSSIVEGQPQVFKLLTSIVPVPAAPHVILMVLVPCPELIIPPETFQLYVEPTIELVV